MNHRINSSLSRKVLVSLALILVSLQAAAQDNYLSGGWSLDSKVSSLTFQSVKNGSTVETSSFASFDGAIDDSGLATITVELNSVDTKVDLRNVRMRFLLFETFLHPTATVTAKVDEAVMQVLAIQKRLALPLEFDLMMHGVSQTLIVETVLTMFAEDQVSISSSAPVNIEVEPFGMLDGIRKLEEAADVQIVPSGSVSFDLTFKRSANGRTSEATNVTAASTPEPVPVQVVTELPEEASVSTAALETSGDFSVEECDGRFATLSQTQAINFSFGSSELDPVSLPLLETILDVIQRCPDLKIVVEGHTDSVGSEELNMRLSGGRARSVFEYLVGQGVDLGRIRAIGYGETQPLVQNDTPRNRARNRRIDFKIDS